MLELTLETSPSITDDAVVKLVEDLELSLVDRLADVRGSARRSVGIARVGLMAV
jgi:hypothetical protein